MAWAFGAAIGGGNNKSAGSDAAFSPTSAIAAGVVLILQAAADNASGTTGVSSDHSVSDTQGNSYTKLDEWTEGNTGAGTGVTISLWASLITTSLATTDSITLHVPSTVAAKAIGGATYTIAAGHGFQLQATVRGATVGASAPVAQAISGLPNREHLFIGASAIDAPTTDTFVTSAGYSPSSNRGTTGGTANSNVWGHSSRAIVTGTSAPTFQPSDSTSTPNWAVILAAIDEVATTARTVSATGATISSSVTAVYASGGGTPPPPPPPPPTPPSPILRVTGRVGCSEYQVYVYPRGLGSRLVGSLDFPGWTALTWEWRYGDKSQATITLADLATAGADCLGTFAKIRKWQHELVIIRAEDGRVWSGPITGRATQSGSGIVTAYSLDVWLERRDLRTTYPQPTNTNKPPNAYELADSYAARWHDAIDRNNDMGYELVVTRPTGIKLALAASKASEHIIMHDAVGPLLDAGLEQVTVDRTTTIGAPSGLLLPRQLVDEHVLTYPDVTEDGLGQANRYGVFAQTPTAKGGNQDPPYAEARNGLQRRDGELYQSEQSSTAISQADAELIAQQRVGVYGDIKPQVASVILRPEAPFPLQTLIPGRLVDVRLFGSPIPVDGLYRITRLGVTLDASQGEQVTVEMTYDPEAAVTGRVE